MATVVALVMANDNKELPIDSLAPHFEYDIINGVKTLVRIKVRYCGRWYCKTINYDVAGDVLNTATPDNEFTWVRVES